MSKNNMTPQEFRNRASVLIKAANTEREVENVAQALSKEYDARLHLAAAEQLDSLNAELIDARHRIMELTQQLDIVMGLEGR